MASVADNFANIHHVASLENASVEDLRGLIRSFPVIDNHASNLLRLEHASNSRDFPLEDLISESKGQAPHEDTSTSLSHVEGIKLLSELYGCTSTLQDIKAARQKRVQRDYTALIGQCLQGTQAIMMADGLPTDVGYPTKWHRQFAPSVSRVVKIEPMASELFEQLVFGHGFTNPRPDADWTRDRSEAVLMRFNTMFRNQIKNMTPDPRVGGFKSVICDRTGLDISLKSKGAFDSNEALHKSSLLDAFHAYLLQAVRSRNYCISHKEVNDYIVATMCDVLHELANNGEGNVPVQFDICRDEKNMNTLKTDPTCLEPLLTRFANVDFVLLHAAYPHIEEAGKVATKHANVWLDLGLSFAMLSNDGEDSMIQQALELTPASKLLWSTDGSHHPESYYLANRQFRSALERVLSARVQAGSVSTAQAIETAVNIMFWNANKVYRLEMEAKYPQLSTACGRHPTEVAEASKISSLAVRAGLNTTPSIPSDITSMTSDSLSQHVSIFDAFLEKNPSVKHIWVQFPDFKGMIRQRMIPARVFRKQLASGRYPGMTLALTGLLQVDTQSDRPIMINEIKVIPDLSSLGPNPVIESKSATVQTWWMDSTDDIPTSHFYGCPRWALQKQLLDLKAEFNLNMLIGFEIEVVFLKPVYNAENSDIVDFAPLHSAHSWSSMTYQDLDTLPMIEETVDVLESLGIEIAQFHAEAAPGQWEFPLPAYDPIKSIDTLLKARDAVCFVARKYGLKATFYPRPNPKSFGSACHTHFSINGTKEEVEKHQDGFLSGILQHLPSLFAFALPLEESYARVASGILSGGEYVCWGTANRESPLRKVKAGHWELRSIDGIGNMYLSMACLVASGLYSLRHKHELNYSDIRVDVSKLTAEQREKLGIKTLLPKSLNESLAILKKDEVLREMLTSELIEDYVNTKRTEMELLNQKTEHERRVWLIQRY